MYKIICGRGNLLFPVLQQKTLTSLKDLTSLSSRNMSLQSPTMTPETRIFMQPLKLTFRRKHTMSKKLSIQNRNSMYYLTAFTVFVGGCTYSSVLLYRLYCQTTGKGGRAVVEEAGERVANMKSVKDRLITVKFNADVNSKMLWNFKPQQPFVIVSPGETALAFYTALNPTSAPVTGVATYNVLPFEAGRYFNKIQCFCFEEQQLNPNEEVDMPVFFYLDPEFAEDPQLENTNEIVLSYTFFQAKEGMHLPRPTFA